MNVTIFHNISTDPQGRSLGLDRGYVDGDELTLVFTMTATENASDLDTLRIVYDILNIGDDPAFFNPPSPQAIAYRKAGNRSLSKGDVVVLDGRAYAVARFGFDRIDLSASSLMMGYAREGFVVDGQHRVYASQLIDDVRKDV